MATMKCPKCGSALDVTGFVPGSSIICACGNVASVPKSSNRKVLYIALGIGAALLFCPCVVGILSAIAIPNFIRFQARSKQVECKMNLKAWYTAQKSHYAEANVYEPDMAAVGFSPERGNRYAYFAGEGPMAARAQAEAGPPKGAVSVGVDTLRFPALRPVSASDLPSNVASRLGLSGACPDCNITLACAGNIDNDDTLDVWVISTGDLEDAFGRPVRAGEPVNLENDVEY